MQLESFVEASEEWCSPAGGQHGCHAGVEGEVANLTYSRMPSLEKGLRCTLWDAVRRIKYLLCQCQA